MGLAIRLEARKRCLLNGGRLPPHASSTQALRGTVSCQSALLESVERGKVPAGNWVANASGS